MSDNHVLHLHANYRQYYRRRHRRYRISIETDLPTIHEEVMINGQLCYREDLPLHYRSSTPDGSNSPLPTILEMDGEGDSDCSSDSSGEWDNDCIVSIPINEVEQQDNVFRIDLKEMISLAIFLLLLIIMSFLCIYLFVPYDEVDTDSALVQMFAHVNAPTCKYIVAIGALAGLTVSMFGSMFPMPRVVYAMAQDGLIFKSLAAISRNTGTPAFATICGGISASFVALMIQLEVLVEMMSIGSNIYWTLVSYIETVMTTLETWLLN